MFRSSACLILLIVCNPAATRADEPKPDELEWIRAHAIAIRTPEAGNGFDDLAPFRELIGDARIVALGEGTHGTREFFQMKHRLVEFLATEMGFTIFSIEANMPEAYAINDYVLGGDGNSKRLIRGMYFWTWDTEEVLALVEWMRRFNRSGAGRIEFTGFDMQTPEVAMDVVLNFLKKVEPQYGAQVDEIYDEIENVRSGGGGFGVATGTFPHERAAGKRIRFSGYIKTQSVQNGFAGLWWRVDGESGVLSFDNMNDRGPRGTTDWKAYAIDLEVAKDVRNINFGALLTGTGTAWFDDLRVEIDGEVFEDDELFDFSFESGRQPKGLFSPAGRYQVSLDDATAHAGKRSLRMQAGPLSTAPGAADAAERAKEVLERLEAKRDAYAAQTTAKDVDWAIQNARVVLQCFQGRANQVQRDVSMAANVKWILDHAPADTKIVLWAHNGHVNRFGFAMGGHLDRTYGEKMVVLGFAANEGKYTAMGDGGLASDHELQPAAPGSVEYSCHKAGVPMFILDLREAAADDPASAWLTRPIRFRAIGALAMENQFSTTNVSKLFDALIYFDKTTASKLLPR